MIPYRMNPMGTPEWAYLMDTHTRFLLYGSLQDRTGLTSVTNHGLVSDGQWISSPDQTSFAVIPADSLPSDVFGTYHDWSLEIYFKIPVNWDSGITRRVGIFGAMIYPARFDVLLYPGSYLGIGSVCSGIYAGTSRECLFTVNYTVGTGYTFKLNKQAVVPGVIEDITTAKDIRANPNGILANVTSATTVDSYAWMIPVKYIRISNTTR